MIALVVESSRIVRFRILLQGMFLVVALCVAGATALPDSDPKLKKAVELYSAAKYDEAISLLGELSKDNTLNKQDRKQALILMGRVSLAKNLLDQARWAVSTLLDLEPPIIELDPDVEMPPLMKIYYEVRKQKTGSTQVERPDPGIQTIAILDFKNRSIDDKGKYDPMEKGFAELLIGQLSGTINLKVIERERIQWILDEIGLENDPGRFDMTSAVRVGKQLGVHTILLGSFIKVSDEIKLLARLVKVETSEILATDEVTGDADKFFELTEKLGEKVARKINVAISKADLEKGTETRSLDAIMSYSEGLVLLEKGDYKSAYEKFIQALDFDPEYSKARTKAESIKPLLG